MTASGSLLEFVDREGASNDSNLSPIRCVSSGSREDALLLEEGVVLLREAEEERAAEDRELDAVLRSLGLLE